jgi:hypothetical protein
MAMDRAVVQPTHSGRRVLHLALRWVLGLTLVATSLGKALDIPGFREVLRTYDLWPSWSLWGIAVLVPVVEALIAAAMLTGRRLTWGIAASLSLHLSFALILTVELWRGIPLQNCGCFGVFLARPLRWYTPLEDLALAAVTLGVAGTRPHAPPAVRGRRGLPLNAA